MAKGFILKNFNRFDFLSDNVNFIYNNNKKINTNFGAGLSIVISLLGILLFGYFSVDLVERAKPITRLSQELRNTSEIKLIDFPISIGFGTKQVIPVENIQSLVTIYASIYKFNNVNGKLIATIIRGFMEKCDPDVHFVKHKELFTDYNKYFPVSIDDDLCLNPNKGALVTNYSMINSYVDPKDADVFEELYISNEYATVPSILLDILVYKCNEDRDKKKCADEETFKSSMKEAYLVLNTVDYFIDLQDLENPNKKIISKSTQLIGYEQPKRSFYQYKKVGIYTDDGFLIENHNNVIDFYQFSNVKLDLFNSDEHFYQMTYEVLHINDIFYRRYEKIQDVLAKVGGIFKFMLIIGQFCIYLYSEPSFYFDITNKLFERTVEDTKNFEIIRDIQNFDNSVANYNKNISTNIINNNTSKLVINNFINNNPPFTLKKEHLSLNFKDYFKSAVCPKMSKYPKKTYKLSIRIIKNSLDILTYFKKLRNIDQVINLITNSEEEKLLFNYKVDLENYCPEDNWFRTQKENYNQLMQQIKNRMTANSAA